MGGGKGGGGGDYSGIAQQALNNQQQISQQLANYATGLANQNAQYYQPLTPLLSDIYKGATTQGSAGYQTGLGNLMNSQGNLQSQTGVNPYAQANPLINYASNISGSPVAQAAGQLQGFYGNEMNQGINPQFAQNAQNQLQQAYQSDMNNAMAHAAPGQNMNALLQAAQNQYLQGTTNLAGNLAGQSQNFANQGAQGVGATAEGLQNANLGMLGAANQAAQGTNQTALQNLISVLTSGAQNLNQAGQFSQLGNQNLNNAMATLGGLGQNYGNQASSFSQMAQQANANQQNMFGGLLGGIGSAASGLGGLFSHG